MATIDKTAMPKTFKNLFITNGLYEIATNIILLFKKKKIDL